MSFRPFQPAPKKYKKWFGRGTATVFRVRSAIQSDRGYVKPVAFCALVDSIVRFLLRGLKMDQLRRLQNQCEQMWMQFDPECNSPPSMALRSLWRWQVRIQTYFRRLPCRKLCACSSTLQYDAPSAMNEMSYTEGLRET